MDIIVYILLPILVGSLVQYGLDVAWPRQPVEDDKKKSRAPAKKADAESAIVDVASSAGASAAITSVEPERVKAIRREQSRQNDKPAASPAPVGVEIFEVPDDFDIREFQVVDRG